jgi:predicted metalloprotease
MTRLWFVPTVLGALLLFVPLVAQAAPPKAKCGPDHAILYKRAVKLVDDAEKKLAAGYTAEAMAHLKEANSLFTILQKECLPQEKKQLLTDQEAQQEAINQKLGADELAQAERLMKSAAEKEKKATQIEKINRDLYMKYLREAKSEYEQAHMRSIRAEIYALRNQQMIFKFLVK